MKKALLLFLLTSLWGITEGQNLNKRLRQDYIVTPSRDTIYGSVRINNGFRVLSGNVRIKDTVGNNGNFYLQDFQVFTQFQIPYRTIFDNRYQRKRSMFYTAIVYPGNTELLAVKNPEYLDYEKSYLKENRRLTRFAYYPVIDYYILWDPNEGGFQVNRRRFKAKLISKMGDNKELVKWIKDRKFDYTQIPKLLYLYNGGDFLSHGKWSQDYVVTRLGDSIFGQVNLSRRLKIYPERKKRFNRYSYDQLDCFQWFSAHYKCLKLDRHKDKKPYWQASSGVINLYVQGVNQSFSFDEKGNILGAYHDSGIYFLEKNGHFYGPISKVSIKRQVKELMGDCSEIEYISGRKIEFFKDLKNIVDYYNEWSKMR